MTMRFPGGAAVDAELGEHRVRTDQTARHGGAGAAPAPFDLFLASIGTCAAFYALRFCQSRGIDTADLAVALETERDAAAKRVARIRIVVEPPAGLPDKYRAALLRSIDQCAVKRHIVEPPEFEIELATPAVAR